MAENTNQFTLKSDPRLEFILVSLTDETYATIVQSLISDLTDYDKKDVAVLEKYKWLVEHETNKVPSTAILMTEFPDLNFDGVWTIQDKDALTDYINIYLNKKRRQRASSRIIELGDRIRTKDLTDEEIQELNKYLNTSDTEEEYESLSDMFLSTYDKRKELSGISFLDDDLDQYTGGIIPGQVCTILGAPGSMKTTYSSNIAFGAIKDGKNVLYLSLEEPAFQLYGKWLSRCSTDIGCPIPQKDIINGALDESQFKTLTEKVIPAFDSYPGKLFILDEQKLPDYKLTTFDAKFRQYDKYAIEQTGHGIDLLVVDHIQLLKFGVPGTSTSDTINMYVTFFRKHSLSWLYEKRQIAVILLSQANREGIAYAQKNDGQYQMQHVAEASELERASSYVISVYTDAMTQITNQLTICAIKLRNGPIPANVIKMYADGSVYQVGLSTHTQSATGSNSVDATTLNLDSII